MSTAAAPEVPPLAPDAPSLAARTTLALCAVLHAFTHAYGTMLVPLYLLMKNDLGLAYVSRASLLVTLYSIVYCLGSYAAGVLADRFDRKVLLGVGLVGHAAAILGLGLVRQYELLVALSVLAGVFATLFHPAANALVTSLFPRTPGMAIGLLGMGAGLGFYAGPQYAGWRAETARWQFASVGDWQRPCVEMGIAGIVAGALFLLLARESGDRRRVNGAAPARASVPMGSRLRRRILWVSLVLACRDFTGVASMSLAAIYLLSAHGLDAKRTGFIVGAMMLVSVVINPLMVWLSPGRRRLPFLSATLVAGGLVIATVPYWSVNLVLPVLCLFQCFQLGSYAVSDAAILERVPAAVRGRVVGLFLTLAGTIASTAPFVMGAWIDRLGQRANEPAAYWPLFVTTGALMVVSAACAPLIARLGAPDQSPVEPGFEVSPTTMEPAV